jgi:hypothetical protein
MRNEFPVCLLTFDAVEIFTDSCYPIGVTHRDNGRSQFLRAEVQVVNAAPFIDDEFAGCYG